MVAGRQHYRDWQTLAQAIEMCLLGVVSLDFGKPPARSFRLQKMLRGTAPLSCLVTVTNCRQQTVQHAIGPGPTRCNDTVVIQH